MQPLQLEAAQRHVMMPKKRAASAEKEQQLGGLPKPCLVCVRAPANLRKSTETQAPAQFACYTTTNAKTASDTNKTTSFRSGSGGILLQSYRLLHCSHKLA